jgi:AraC-like DNA-binding protein
MEALSQVLLIAGAQGSLLGLVLIVSGWHKKPSVFLGIILGVLAVELLNAWAMSIRYHQQSDAFPFWTFGSYLFLPPALWLFLHTSFDRSFQYAKKYWWLFMPALVEVLTEFCAFYGQKLTGRTWPLAGSTAWYLFTEVLPVAAMIAVLAHFAVRSGSLITTPDKRKQQGFLLVFGLLAVLWVADAFLQLNIFRVIALFLCLLIFCLGYVVYFRPGFFEPPSVEKPQQPANLFLHYDEAKATRELKALFDERKIYRRPRLTVEELAQELDLPARYVSYLINHVCDSSFSHFVNNYRVCEVLERLKNPRERHKNLLGIALDSGFSSKSSFNLIFKNLTGEPPSAYLAKQKKTAPETGS